MEVRGWPIEVMGWPIEVRGWGAGLAWALSIKVRGWGRAGLGRTIGEGGARPRAWP